MNGTHLRRMLVVAGLATAALGTASPASAECTYAPGAGGATVGACSPSPVCHTDLCHWEGDLGASCTYDGTVLAISKVCATVDGV